MAAAQYVFPGRVTDAGTPVVEDEDRYQKTLKALAGKRVEWVIRKPQDKRTLDMNAYLHAKTGPFRLLAEHFGDDIEGVKYDLMGECFGWVKGPVSGRLIPVKAHTSDMTREESAYFVDWVIPWAAKNHGVLIPLPKETL